MSTLLHDLRFSLRLFTKAPGFTAASIAVLALGIGVNTGIFSIVNELLFSPRGFPRPAEVVQIYAQDKTTKAWRTFSYPGYVELRQQSTSFTGIFAHALAMVGVGEGEATRRAHAGVVSSNFFSVLEAPLARGRAFTPAEEQPGGELVTIVSHSYWQRTGFDPALVGKTLRINERLFTVVGITPEDFTGTTVLVGPELYFPLGCFDIITGGAENETKRTLGNARAFQLIPVGRLKPGVSLEQADAELQTLARRLESALADEQGQHTMLARPLRRLGTSSGARNDNEVVVVGFLLMGMAAIVLLIACLNLANMLLARGSARRREIAIRLALGGARGRIVRQLLTEGAVLALAGGAGGWVLGLLAAHALASSFAAQFPFVLMVRGGADPRLFMMLLGFCGLATLLFALGPALKLSRRDVLPDLKAQAGEDPVTRRHSRWLPRNLLVVAQIALSLGLLTAAALFIRGALKAGNVETGFNADHTIVLEVDASLGSHREAQALELYRAATERLAALPGVQAASMGAFVPFGMSNSTRRVQRASLNPPREASPATAADGRMYSAQWNSVGADYFTAMGLPVLRGRAFTKLEAETRDGPRVVIIDEKLAQDLWPDEDALGKHVQWGVQGATSLPRSLEVVGIVPASRMKLFQNQLMRSVFVPFAQGFQSNAFIHVRAARTDAAMFDLIRREVRAAAPGVPLFAMKTFRQHIDTSVQLWTVRAGAALFTTFGALALLLAVVGVYGVKAYSVARRTREIGIRMALGAEPRDVVGLIFREGLVMTLSGAALGLLLALGIGQLLAKLLYQVSPFDPFAFTLAPLVLIATALFACWLPARRATRVDPLRALRTE